MAPQVAILSSNSIIDDSAKRLIYGDGPWVGEPDHVSFKYRGATCYVYRMMTLPPSKCPGGYFRCNIFIPNIERFMHESVYEFHSSRPGVIAFRSGFASAISVDYLPVKGAESYMSSSDVIKEMAACIDTVMTKILIAC